MKLYLELKCEDNINFITVFINMKFNTFVLLINEMLKFEEAMKAEAGSVRWALVKVKQFKGRS
jgi:hypothetical protein